MRTPIIAGNWKMYKTPQEAVAFVNAIKGGLAPTSKSARKTSTGRNRAPIPARSLPPCSKVW
jgi:hypothetical protein